ncbi:hypothetical protein [Mammaliicoccus vitulinus]|uniref:hypothetical protein n=1 Tax=Mammaliicoccus vitulinus TaxID=71237 RepID=UPI003F9D8CD8
MIRHNFKHKRVNTGTRNKIVEFYRISNEGPEADNDSEVKVFESYANVYSSSTKDVEVVQSTRSNDLVTIKILDTNGEYIPQTSEKFKIKHPFYDYGFYEIKDISLDEEEKELKIVGELKR